MSILKEIQGTLISGRSDIGPLLLKLRLLSSQVGISTLDNWVKFETEGYSTDVELPDYRKIAVSFTGSFSGPLGSGINNAPIPTSAIKKFAGPNWSPFKFRQSIASIDDLIDSAKDSGAVALDASNLIFQLQGKIYEDYACNAVYGLISKSALVEIQNAVRSRIMELTIKLDQSSPEVAKITLEQSLTEIEKSKINTNGNTYQNIVYGNVTSLQNGGSNSNLSINVSTGQTSEIIRELTKAGIPKKDAENFAQILQTEDPTSDTDPFGEKAKKWVAKNIGNAWNGSWKIGGTVATTLITEAAKKFYGL